MAEEVFLTAEPLFAHFRITSPEAVTDSGAAHQDYLLREFDGHRYTAPLATTLLDERMLFVKQYYDALVQEFTRLGTMLEHSDTSHPEQFLENAIDTDGLISDYQLDLGRLDEELIRAETDRWIKAAKSTSPRAVADHLEEYLTGQVDVDKTASTRLDLRQYRKTSQWAIEDLQNKLGESTGAILAGGVEWYDERAEGLDLSDQYPLIVTKDSQAYEDREEIYGLLAQRKNTPSYNSPVLKRPLDIQT